MPRRDVSSPPLRGGSGESSHADGGRRERGLAAYASQFRVPLEDIERYFESRFGKRLATEAINAAGGGAWEDDVLSLRDRSLIVVAALIAQGALGDRLRGHIRWAIDHGSSHQELEALVTLLALYVGHPPASVAMEILREELPALGAP